MLLRQLRTRSLLSLRSWRLCLGLGLVAVLAVGAPAEEGGGPGEEPGEDWQEQPFVEPDDWFWSADVDVINAIPIGGNGAELRFWVETDGSNVTVPIFPPFDAAVSVELRRVEGGPPRIVTVRNGIGRPLVLPITRVTRRRTRSAAFSMARDDVFELVVATTDRTPGAFQLILRVQPAKNAVLPLEPLRPFLDDQVILATEPGLDPAPWFKDLELKVSEPEIGLSVARVGRDGWAGSVPWTGEEPRWETPAGGTHEGPSSFDWAALFARLYAGVAHCEPDVQIEVPAEISDVADGSHSNRIIVGSTFGRRDYDRQRALRDIRASAGHRSATGAGVVVAVLDTGIDLEHPLFDGRLEDGYDFVDNDEDPSERRDDDDSNDDGRTSESFGHGTFVAGVVLAAAPDARILPVRVLDDDGRGATSDVARGIYWAVNQGADVINLSLGTAAFSATLAEAVRFARRRDVPIVAAAGNDGQRWVVDFPGTEPGVISATALDARGRRARFANGHRSSAVAAPGQNVIGPYPGGRWARGRGTSFSAAWVSGAVALMRESHPTWRSVTLERRMTKRWKLDLKRLAR